MTELRWRPAAAHEAQAARRWYQAQQNTPAIARRFQSTLRRAVTDRVLIVTVMHERQRPNYGRERV
jgi:plasmid stabilization system protein ParE